MASGEFFQQSPHATQIDQDASLPFSLPSQPPDIANWFSSYEYESPVCSDSFHLLEDASKELLLNDSAEEGTISTEEEKLVENGNPSFSEETPHNEYSLELNSLAHEGRNYLTFDHESALKSITEDETIGTNDIWQSKFCPTQKNEYFPIIKKENYESLHNISNKNGIWQCEGLRKHDDGELMSKQGGRSSKEQKENVEMKAENGFISTRNRDGAKKNGEISKPQCLIVNGKRSRTELQEDNVVLEKEQPLSARGVLAEKTNVCIAEEAIKEEAPGKWMCPRKSKPYAGPPLKQLRLERWLHREV
ncbi:hypothetical protein KFK09_007637 [Dendrobium nobile]|uniref:Uncharacterized protein n=1 Tax=Dendrobium nobile TaxID=94219 RepID=A0A8T3BVS4_DENNO|nr:hypothetical protein KFK09_007637 [Dendrobium nobile]